MGAHPTRCWELDGHEMCALVAATTLLEERANRAAALARTLRIAAARSHRNGRVTDTDAVIQARTELILSSPTPRTWKRNPKTVLYGEKHPRAKLTNAQVDELRKEWEALEPAPPGKPGPYVALAAKYGISKTHMNRLVRGKGRVSV